MEAGVLREGRATFSLDLHPAYSNNALQGVQQQLDSRLLRYSNLVSTLKDSRALQRGIADTAILFPQNIARDSSGKLRRWDDGLGGVLLAYKNLQRLPAQVLAGHFGATTGPQSIASCSTMTRCMCRRRYGHTSPTFSSMFQRMC